MFVVGLKLTTMKQRTLPIDPNTQKPFQSTAEMRAWKALEKFILTGQRTSNLN